MPPTPGGSQGQPHRYAVLRVWTWIVFLLAAHRTGGKEDNICLDLGEFMGTAVGQAEPEEEAKAWSLPAPGRAPP